MPWRRAWIIRSPQAFTMLVCVENNTNRSSAGRSKAQGSKRVRALYLLFYVKFCVFYSIRRSPPNTTYVEQIGGQMFR